jgi:hypothetical protein
MPPQCGTVIDVQILRERATGQSRGCAFVGYETSQEAEAAIEQLNHRVHLPGAATPLEVSCKTVCLCCVRAVAGAARGSSQRALGCCGPYQAPAAYQGVHSWPATAHPRCPATAVNNAGPFRAQPPVHPGWVGAVRQQAALLLARATQRG